MKLKNVYLHFMKICQHKYWVFHYCNLAGITWRGIKHDMSKFSPTEFFESVKYFKGTSSPIDECKKVNGVSYAWMHHKGRNDHHYEYWVDNLDKGGKPIQMPFKSACEMLCDFLGAGRAYNGKKFTYLSEFVWFSNKLATKPAMHIQTIKFIYIVLAEMAKFEVSKRGFPETYIESHIRKEHLNKDDLFYNYQRASLMTDAEFMHLQTYFLRWHRKHVGGDIVVTEF